MNLDWDRELEEYFNPLYIKQHAKVAEGQYLLTLLEGIDLRLECSVEGYRCECHGKVYELPIGMLRDHSPLYCKVYMEQLNKKL